MLNKEQEKLLAQSLGLPPQSLSLFNCRQISPTSFEISQRNARVEYNIVTNSIIKESGDTTDMRTLRLLLGDISEELIFNCNITKVIHKDLKLDNIKDVLIPATLKFTPRIVSLQLIVNGIPDKLVLIERQEVNVINLNQCEVTIDNIVFLIEFVHPLTAEILAKIGGKIGDEVN